jgi:hypothetical protein
MLTRTLILLLVALTIALGWGLLRLWRAQKVRRLSAVALFFPLIPPGRPAVIAFSTPTCAECRTRQAPALARLAATLGDTITITSLSALDHPDLVRQAGILTVPATVIVDSAGQVRHLNLGYASDTRLREQVLGLAA